MKRLLLAAGLALTIHGILLGAEPHWIKRKLLNKPEPRVVTLTLSYRQSQRPDLKTTIKSTDIHTKTTPVVKKIEQKHSAKKKPPQKRRQAPKRNTKPKKTSKKVLGFQKLAKASIQPEKENVPEVTADTPFPSKSEPFPEPEHPKIGNELFESWVDFVEEALISPEQVVREARPMYRMNPPPNYPRLARKRGYEGTVVLKVLVNRKGKVKDLYAFTSSGYAILDKAAIVSVKDWIFEPGMRGDEEVEMWVQIPIRFKLK
jgi:protein TonB